MKVRDLGAKCNLPCNIYEQAVVKPRAGSIAGSSKHLFGLCTAAGSFNFFEDRPQSRWRPEPRGHVAQRGPVFSDPARSWSTAHW